MINLPLCPNRLSPLLIAACLVLPLATRAADTGAVALFTHTKTLTAQRDEEALPRRDVGAAPLDGDVFERLDPDRADLRVFDSELTEIPMLLRRSEELKRTTRMVTHQAAITAFTPSTTGPSTLEARLPGDKLRRLHAVELSVPIRDFERVVSVSVSTDGQTWTEVATGVPIYDYTRFVQLRRTLIDFDPVEARFIRLSISSISEDKLSPLTEITRENRVAAGTVAEFRKTSTVRVDFKINAITAHERVSSKPSRKVVSAPVPVSGMAVNQYANRQETVLTFRTRRQPVKQLTLTSVTANFSRRAVLEGRWKAGEGTWSRLASGALSQISIRNHSTRALTLQLPAEARCAEYRLVIRNQDSPPLSDLGVSLSGPVYECVFFLEHNPPFSLYYGGARVSLPRYDIADVLARAPSYECKGFRPDAEQPNPHYRKLARARTSLSWRIVFVAAIAIAVLALSWVIIHMAKGIKLDDQ
jgi:hypothetical protein